MLFTISNKVSRYTLTRPFNFGKTEMGGSFVRRNLRKVQFQRNMNFGNVYNNNHNIVSSYNFRIYSGGCILNRLNSNDPRSQRPRSPLVVLRSVVRATVYTRCTCTLLQRRCNKTVVARRRNRVAVRSRAAL